MSLVVDTDVVSFLFKQDTRADLYRPHLNSEMLVISFMTLAELEQWTIMARWGTKRRNDLLNYLRRYLVEPSSPQLCRLWAEVMDSGRRKGRPISVADAWIAATALHYNVPLVTNNRDDYAGVDGLKVISEQR